MISTTSICEMLVEFEGMISELDGPYHCEHLAGLQLIR